VTGRLVAWLGLVAVLTALSYGGRAAEGKPDSDVLYRYSTAANAVVFDAIILAVVLAIAWGGGPAQLLALREPRSWPGALGLAAMLLVGIYLLSGIVLAIGLHPGEEQGLTPPGWEPDRAGAFAANVVAIAVVAPTVEELTFRGLGYSLLEPYGRTVAIVVVGITFGLIHGLVEALPLLAALGAGLAWLRSRTASVYPCIVVHATFNAIALAVSVTT
jgi:membrane protease YdiL (CAAX protease family)